MKKLLKIFGNPFFLSVIPAVILIWVIPFDHSRYILETQSKENLRENRYVWFEDLTKDGYSEEINLTDFGHLTTVVIYDHKGALFNQWNLRGNVRFRSFNRPFLSGDYNGNGNKELFFFTLSNDSIFLHIIDDLSATGLRIRDRFIARTGPGKTYPDPSLIPAHMDDLNGNGLKELIFGISGGFSLFPRNVFAYYLNEDSLVSSPESAYTLGGILQEDLTGNGKKELILSGSSTANVTPEEARFHDHSNWLMVLDQNLEFVFEPVEIPGRAVFFDPMVLRQGGENRLAGICHKQNVGEMSRVLFFDKNGNPAAEQVLGIASRRGWFNPGSTNEAKLMLSCTESGLNLLDTDFNIRDRIPFLQYSSVLKKADLSRNGSPELIIPDLPRGKFFVFRSNLRHHTAAPVDWAGTPYLLSLVKHPDHPTGISFQTGRIHYLFAYRQNPALYLNYLYYLFIYGGMLGFAMITRKVQKNQLKKKFETEKKISELQLSLLKNQLDPHFTYNVIHSVMQSLQQEKNMEACKNLKRFARMNKELLLAAGNFQRSLKEELDFCRDYLELEKARFQEAFDFRISVDPEVDKQIRIPKMIIQTYTENAVKHGLLPKNNGGFINIEVEKQNHGADITITDNGVGRKAAAGSSSYSTGKGLAIMEDFYQLYNKYSKQTINSEITDLYDNEGQPVGTQVLIKIRENHETP